MSYTTRSAIAAKIKTSLIVRACDDNEDGQEDAGAFAALQQDIDDEIDGILGASYEVPFVSAPAAVTAAAKVMLCELVYQKCATPEKENPWTERAKWWRERLEKIAAGSLSLDAGTYSDPAGAIADEDRDFDLANQDGF